MRPFLHTLLLETDHFPLAVRVRHFGAPKESPSHSFLVKTKLFGIDLTSQPVDNLWTAVAALDSTQNRAKKRCCRFREQHHLQPKH